MNKPTLKDGWFECLECEGTGDCPYCDGEGCQWCEYSGQCPECEGSGVEAADDRIKKTGE